MHSPAEIAQHASETPQAGYHRWVGLTTAFLSILIAVCSSQANGIRTDFIAMMVQEDGATVRYQTVSTKYLTLQSQLQHIHAMMPDPPLFAAAEAELKKLEAGKMNEESAQVVKALRLNTRKILNSVMPSPDDVKEFAKRIRTYRTELDVSRQWADSYRPVIRELGIATTRLENAQLISELAVIMASLALMLGSIKKLSRTLWLTSLGLGVFSIGILVATLVIHRGAVHRGEEQVEQARDAYLSLIKGENTAQRDEELLKGIEADLKKIKIDQ